MLNNSSDVFAHSNLLDDIALIDLQPVVRDNNPAIIAEQIVNACKSHGFFYIINHGVDDDLVNEHTLNMKKFFNLPLDKKLELDGQHFN